MKGRQITYTEEELSWIKAHKTNARKDSHAEFCRLFLRDDVSLNNYNALCKRKGWMTGRTGCFNKGNIAHNKGKKMPFNANRAKTQFKKGGLPPNTNYIGHERLSKDGYVEVSVAETNPHTGADRRYVHKHRHLWEKQNGKIPDGMCLKCLDGNKQNTTPNNWELIPREVLARLNGGRFRKRIAYDQASPELKPTVMAIAKLEHAASEVKSR